MCALGSGLPVRARPRSNVSSHQTPFFDAGVSGCLGKLHRAGRRVISDAMAANPAVPLQLPGRLGWSSRPETISCSWQCSSAYALPAVIENDRTSESWAGVGSFSTTPVRAR